MEKGWLIILFILVNLLVVQAVDVAYVVKNRANPVYTNILNSKNLSYDVIPDRSIPNTNFMDYNLIFVDDGILKYANYIPISEHNSLIANSYHYDDFGLTEDISFIGANQPLTVYSGHHVIEQVYNRCCDNKGIALPMYYLEEQFVNANFNFLATTTVDGHNTIVGGLDKGEVLGSNILEGNLCFFGIIKTMYWTDATKNLFERCLGFALRDGDDNGDDDGGDDGDDDEGVKVPIPKDGNVLIKLIRVKDNEVILTKLILVPQNNNFYDFENLETDLVLPSDLITGDYDIVLEGFVNDASCNVNYNNALVTRINIRGDS